MKERPILFSPPMIRAILDGKKTQTRRVVMPSQSTPKVPPLHMYPWIIDDMQEVDEGGLPCWVGEHPDYPTGMKWFSCPKGSVGDRLWVREAYCQLWFNREDGWQTFYKADDNMDYVRESAQSEWKPSIHMPRWAARLFLEVTDVRVERLHDISEEDAHHEGWDWSNHDLSKKYDPVTMDTARRWFASLWDSIKGDKHPWASNPFVWRIAFRRIEVPQ